MFVEYHRGAELPNPPRNMEQGPARNGRWPHQPKASSPRRLDGWKSRGSQSLRARHNQKPWWLWSHSLMAIRSVVGGAKRGVVERNRAPDQARAMLGERGRVRGGRDGARGDSQHIGAVVSWHVRKMGRKLRRRTGASACRDPKARV